MKWWHVYWKPQDKWLRHSTHFKLEKAEKVARFIYRFDIPVQIVEE